MRTEKAIKNVSYAIIGQTIGIVISFVSRIFFIRYLGIVFLGLSGLFSNILTVLSLAELGFATAMTYSLYKPLANDNKQNIIGLMNYFSAIYKKIGLLMLVIGLIIIPAIPFLIKDIPSINYDINLIYILYLMNTVISYFFAYKRILLIADQKRYITTFYRYMFYSIVNILQIIILHTTGNFYLFLIIQIFTTFAENIFISLRVNKEYSYLKSSSDIKLEKDEIKSIKSNVKALFLHRFGGVVSTGMISILISAFVGLSEVGIYSNYLLIISALGTVYEQVFDSVTSSIGNLGTENNQNHEFVVFNRMLFFNHWLYGFSIIALIVLLNPFIETIWLNSDMIFSVSISVLIALRFYVDGIRKSVLTFRNAKGLFWQDRYKPLIQAFVGSGLAILLSFKMGLSGILLGSLAGTILVTTYIEPYILFKYGFKKNVIQYFSLVGKYIALTILVLMFTVFVSSLYTGSSIAEFIYKVAIVIFLPNLLFYLIFRKNANLSFFINSIKSRVVGYMKSRNQN